MEKQKTFNSLFPFLLAKFLDYDIVRVFFCFFVFFGVRDAHKSRRTLKEYSRGNSNHNELEPREQKPISHCRSEFGDEVVRGEKKREGRREKTQT